MPLAKGWGYPGAWGFKCYGAVCMSTLSLFTYLDFRDPNYHYSLSKLMLDFSVPLLLLPITSTWNAFPLISH